MEAGGSDLPPSLLGEVVPDAARLHVAYGLAPALAQAYISSNVSEHVITTLNECFPTAQSVRSKPDMIAADGRHVCLPLFMDTKMRVLQQALSATRNLPPEHHEEAAYGWTMLYNSLIKDHDCLGALVVTTHDPLLFYGSLLAFYLPPSQDHRAWLLAAAASASASQVTQAVNTQLTRWLTFEDPDIERGYERWLGHNNLKVQRLMNIVTGYPWNILSGVVEPWNLIRNAPIAWVITLAYLLTLSWILFLRPNIYRNHYHKVTLYAWCMSAWFFPLTTAHLQAQRLPVEQLCKGPWFQLSLGCLTALVVPVVFMGKFIHFIPFQTLTVLAHLPCMMVLATRIGLQHTVQGALCWHLLFSYMTVGLLVYFMDRNSRRSYVLSLHASSAARPERTKSH